MTFSSLCPLLSEGRGVPASGPVVGQRGAVSSAVEHCPYKARARGSNPLPPNLGGFFIKVGPFLGGSAKRRGRGTPFLEEPRRLGPWCGSVNTPPCQGRRPRSKRLGPFGNVGRRARARVRERPGRSNIPKIFVLRRRTAGSRGLRSRFWGRGVARLTRRPVKAETAGSNPVDPATFHRQSFRWDLKPTRALPVAGGARAAGPRRTPRERLGEREIPSTPPLFIDSPFDGI